MQRSRRKYLPWLGLGKLERHELTWLVIGLGACVLLLVFLLLAGEVIEGETLAFDTRILQALRSAADPARPVGPRWMETALLDLSALGGPTVLFLVVFAVVGFLALQGRYRTAAFVSITCISGELVNIALKRVFARPRPSVVPHLHVVFSPSFPSGHAMESAIVYLTLGAILMRIAERRLTKIYILGMAMLLTALVGFSRVNLGVHYPTDVIGGWIIGFVWASLCWLAEQFFERGAGIDAERAKSSK
jgi:undecaprenyl-diphosphatase